MKIYAFTAAPGRVFGRLTRASAKALQAFTLLEVMIVVGIMALAMTISVPIVYRVTHKDAFYGAVSDVMEVCSNARAQAILQNKISEVVFFPQDGRVEMRGAVGSSGFPQRASAAGLKHSGTSAVIGRSVGIDMLDINLMEFKDKEEGHVRFYPNGTCDEMTLILRSPAGEQRGITLEITTGLATVLSVADLQRLRNGTL